MRHHPFLDIAVGVAVLGMLLGPAGVDAQLPIEPPSDFESGMRTGAGWQMVLPDALVGVGAFHFLRESPWGLLAGWAFKHDTLRDDPLYYREWSVSYVQTHFPQDIPLRDWDEWRFLNLGVLRQVSPEMAIYLGGGAARRTVIREYFDDSLVRSPVGRYYVGHEALSGWESTWNAGVLIRAGRLLILRAGYESAAASLSLGVYWAFQ
jgi:hypothetical protein